MFSPRILVYSPDIEIGHELAIALRKAIPRYEIQVSERYPTTRDIEASDQRELGAVVIGLTSGSEGLQVIKSFRLSSPEIPTVAVGREESSQALLEAMRAGATDYLSPPFDGPKLANLLQSLPDRAGRTAANRLLCFAPCQATDGASTIALHVAHSAPTLTEKTALLLDCDIHSSTLAFRLGSKFDFNLNDAFENAANIDDLWLRLATEWKGFRVLPCPTEGEPPTEALRRRLPEVVASASGAFDTVVADLPSSFSPTIAEIARQSERLYLVCTPQLVSVHLARRRLDELKVMGVERAKVRLIVNRFDSRSAVSSTTIEDALKMSVDFSIPNDFDAVNQAEMRGGLVSSGTKLSESLTALARQIFGVSASDKNKGSAWQRLFNLTKA